MKKILALILALALVGAMAASAFAASSPAPVVTTEPEEDTTTTAYPDGTVVVTVDGKDIVMTDLDGEYAWAKEDIIKVVTAGLMVGYPDGKFHPEKGLTAAMVYTVLARIAGADITTLGDDWDENATAWAVANGYAIDVDPADEITRAQMMEIMENGTGLTADDLLIGDQNGELNLDKGLNRAEFATILVRYLAAK